MAAITWDTHDKLDLGTRAAICVVFAGLVHLFSAPQHLDHVGHALFLILAGVTEVAWGLAFWRKPSAALYSLGVVLAGTFIVLWTITRVVPAPFGHGPGDVEVVGIISKLGESVGLGGLLAMALLGAQSRGVRWPAWKTVLAPLALAVTGAFVLYGAGLAAEQMLPWLGGQGSSGSEQHVHSATSDAASAPSAPIVRLAVIEDGVIRALENGGRVTLADGVAADVFLTPYPPGRRTNLYFRFIQDGGGPAMSRPQVSAEYSMLYMNHGKYTQAGLELQPGRYMLPLNFLMSGEWGIDLQVGWSERTARIRLVTKVVP